MATLSPASTAALARLRAFKAPSTNYLKLPLTRRAAVLILLFADRRGDLRVILTIRSAQLRNYAGQAALPGGKADSDNETPWITARREAEEEIGLSAEGARLPTSTNPKTAPAKLPPDYSVEYLTELPANLAMTELGVRPVVAWLRSKKPTADPSRDLLPTLDNREVAALFTAPFEAFLAAKDQDPAPGEWYKGAWHSWHHEPWRMHMFHVPVTPRSVFRSHDDEKTKLDAGTAPCSPLSKAPILLADRAAQAYGRPELATNNNNNNDKDPSEKKDAEEDKKKAGKDKAQDALDQPRYRVFGMTARILVDAARVAYGRDPEFEHNSTFGDEEMIAKLLRLGRLSEKRGRGEVLTREVMQAASKVELQKGDGKGKL